MKTTIYFHLYVWLSCEGPGRSWPWARLIDQFYTLQRLYTFTIARVKISKNFEPNHACDDQAQYHTYEVWLHRDATKPLQRYAKAPTTHDSYSSGRTITLPSGHHLSKGCYPKRTGLYPCNPEPPVFLSDKITSTIAHLINCLSQIHMDCGCTVFLGGSPCSDSTIWSCYYP
jgi:hypothetical protein